MHLVVVSQLTYTKKKEEKKQKTALPDLHMEVEVRKREDKQEL